MRSLESIDLSRLEWDQPKGMRRYFELRSGDDVVATMEWTGAFSNRAIVTSTAGRWFIDRPGFWQRKVVAWNADSNTRLAALNYNLWHEGDLVLASEQAFHWGAQNFWRTRWAFTDAAGQPVVQFNTGNRWFRMAGTVKIPVGAERRDELLLLIVTGWYLAYMARQDAAVAASAAGAGS
jgi:hypothetical protein